MGANVGLVICSACAHFIPSETSPKQAFGFCGALEAYKKIPGVTEKMIESAELKLGYSQCGLKQFYPNAERRCEKYVNKTPAAGELLTGVPLNQEEL